MALVVTFTGKSAVPSVGSGSTYQVWSYSIDPGEPGDLVVGQRIALALPSDANVQDPSTFGDVAALSGMFMQRDATSSRQYVGRVVDAAGTQTISFVAPPSEAPRELLLVTRMSGQPWAASAFATSPAGLLDVVHALPAPAAATASSGPSGLVGTDSVGILPYASEPFGVYQPLLGWRSALNRENLAAATANRFVRAANLVGEAAELTAKRPIAKLSAAGLADRTGTAVGRQLAAHVADAGAKTTQEWRSILSASGDSPLVAITRNVVSGLQQPGLSSGPSDVTKQFYTAGPKPAASPGGIRIAQEILSSDRVTQEAAAATLLHYLGQASPDTVAQMFTATMEPWERVLAAAEWFSGRFPSQAAFLAPIGILHLFREYFFELGTFLGPPVGHVWLSPGGTVELLEVNTRRTLVETTVEQSTDTVQKTELDQSTQDELSDAVKVENANDTKLGVTATGSGGVTGVFQASASASFNLDSSRKQAQEQTHKQMRQQSSKLSSEVRQNYKTTFRTTTETTDTSSRRYVLQNTSTELVSYELSRKMRKVAVQVQDLGQQLCWQLYVDNPGDTLGLGEFVHATSAALDPGVKPPDLQPYPSNQQQTYNLSIPFVLYQGADHDAGDTYQTDPDDADHGRFSPDVGSNDIIQFRFSFKCPPSPPGFVLSRIAAIDFHGAQVQFTINASDLGLGQNPDPATDSFTIRLTYANFGGRQSIPFDVIMDYEPTQEAKDAIDKANAAAKAAYDDQVALKKEQLFYDTLRTRLKLVGQVKPRPQDDLREEERNVIYRAIIARLYGNESGWTSDDYHVASELIRYLFDVDSMLYFVAPDWWRPRQQPLVSKDDQGELQPTIIAEPAVSSRALQIGKYEIAEIPGHRPYYLITEETTPAPQGASLGWLIQLDGDTHRNAFLNSPWVKAILPIRPGRERDALAWLQRPEVAGTDGLDQPYPYDQSQDPPEYQGLTIGQVLLKIADRIAEEYQQSLTPVPADPTGVNPQLALPAETVFTHGFDPLEGGIKFTPDAFKVFSQWIEVLPTDQIVATEYKLTGL